MRIEKVFASIFLVGVIFKFLHWPGAGPLLIVSLMILSLLYFPLGFYFFCDKEIKKQNLALSIVSGMFFALVPMGILFKLMYWPPVDDRYLLISAVSMPVFLGIIYFMKKKAPEELNKYYKNMFLRTSVLVALTTIFFYASRESLIKIQYRDDPELARLKTLWYMHPGNIEYEKQHDAYLAKRDSLFLNETK